MHRFIEVNDNRVFCERLNAIKLVIIISVQMRIFLLFDMKCKNRLK
jgi:hypothetical protein